MKSVLLLLMFGVFCHNGIQAQTFESKVNIDSVLIGNYIELKFSTDEVKSQFEAPELDGFQIVSGPNSSMSTQYINGEYSGQKTISYQIKPLEEGQVIIAPGYFILNGETHETQPIKINVYPNPEGIIQQPQNQEHNFFFKSFEFPGFEPEEQKPTKKKRKLKRL